MKKDKRLLELAGITTEGKFKDGQRVRLKPDKDEGWPEQFGKVLGAGATGTYMISLDKKYREDQFEDGLREVGEDQLELAKK